MAKLLDITGKLEGNKYTYTMRLPQGVRQRKGSGIGTYGMSVCMYHDITGNCQIGSVQVAQKLSFLTIPEFKEFFDTIFYNAINPNTGRANFTTPWYKTSLMIDVHTRYVNKLIYRFSKINAKVRLKKAYLNRTGSHMTILVIDLRGDNANGQ